MKMAGPVLSWRSLCSSSSSSPGLIRNLLSRSFSAPPSRQRITIVSSELAKAHFSEHWYLFKLWMSKHNKSYKSDEDMLHRFGIFTNYLKFKEKRYKEISRYILGLNQFSDDLKYIEKMNKKISRCKEGLNEFSEMASKELSLPERRYPRPIISLYASGHADLSGGELAKAKSSEYWEVFESWMSKHKKSYGSDEEMLHRFGIFTDNLKYIEKTNKKLYGFKLELDQFSDKTFEELPLCVGRHTKPMISGYTSGHVDFDGGELAEAQSSEHWEVFKSWMSNYNKSYKSDKEMLHRFGIFIYNLKYMEKTNEEISRHKVELHKLADVNLKMFFGSL